ncbi:MAG: FAD-dependent oxidoreductase [Caldilineaceae bacterium]|nr:FAD-dependent oxidoreductase [Caldilineaceae bacterium]
MTLTAIIIGGDAAGMSAASKIKREVEDADVIVFEKTQTISYSACGMPYWIAGIIDEEEDLLIVTPEKARSKRGLDVRLGHVVTAVDPDAKTVSVTNLEQDAAFTQPYDVLVIATGARPMLPPIPGMDLPGVFVLRAFADSQRIHRYLAEYDPESAVIIGGGYIGVEMAEALRERDMDVHIVEMLPQIMPNFDEEMVQDASKHLQEQGVELHLGTSAQGVEQRGERLAVKLAGGRELVCEMVIVSVGVQPNSELAAEAGLALTVKNAIKVDDHMRTSAADIWAAGDCVAHRHAVLEEETWIPLAPSANKGGRVAGENASGGDAAMSDILGTAVVKVFDYTLSVTGLTERAARESGKFGPEGEEVGAATITAYDRGHYWPGASKIKVKLVADRRNGKILGGQLSGKAGVNKRIDIIATAIAAGMTVDELAMLDLSYAPPYSAPYDPVQVCANVASKQVRG